jgi:hypothetical protein
MAAQLAISGDRILVRPPKYWRDSASNSLLGPLSGAAAQPVSYSATVFWTANSASVSGFNVYRSSVPGGPYARLNSSLVTAPTYDDATALASQTYFYTVTAVDGTGNESAHSNEMSGRSGTLGHCFRTEFISGLNLPAVSVPSLRL